MPNVAGTIESIALELGEALAPLQNLLGPDIFARLGVEVPEVISGNGTVQTKLTESATRAGELPPLVADLASAISSENTSNILTAVVPLIAKVAELIVQLKETGDAVHAAAGSLSPAEKAAMEAFAEEMAVRTLEYAVVGYLDENLPTLTNTLSVLGLMDKEYKPSPALEVSETSRDIIPRRIHLDKLPRLINNPAVYFQDTFQWGNSGFGGNELLRKVQGLLESLGIPAILYEETGQPAVLEAYLFNVQVDNSANPPGLKFELNIPGNATFHQEVAFSDLWKGTVDVTAAFAGGVEGTIKPPFHFNIKPPTGNLDLNLLLGLKAVRSDNEPIIIVGVTGGTRLQAKSLGGSVGTRINVGTGGTELLPSLQIAIEEGKLIIDFSQGDGFIKDILSGIKLEADFDLLGDWNPKDGLRFQGSGGVEILIPVHIDLTVIEVNGIYVYIGFSNETPLRLELATNLATHLGPLDAAVDRIGIRMPVKFPEDGGGNLGMADIGFEFLPPKGVGLSIDTGVIKGGGFLSLDYEKGEYIGVLELSFQGIIDLKAIGIINTKLPDGSEGFALLVLVTAEFTPIQLGFGFTLVGVGGLLGLNRSTDLDALRAGVRTGAVSSILFPKDVVANVHRIISDLKTIFPIVQEHFIIAPMGKLGWGTPTLISLELGVIIDIPSPQLTIIGVLRCVLPTEEAAILKLQVNFAGGIDFEEGLIWFDASLFDSKLLTFTLSGDMALRIGWGSSPLFIISVGGFHPSFNEIPPDLTGMTRLTISLLSGNNPRITVQTYFAITSNTVQSGARVELYAAAAGFNIYGFLGYDLLVQFNPFYFIAQIYAGLALRRGTSEIAGVQVNCELSGPTPWNANGKASLKILFFKITVSFNETWGEKEPSQPLESEDVLELIYQALLDSRNWKAELPANTQTNVSVKSLELPADEIIIHPFTILSVSQKVVPLQLQIDKFGNKKPSTDTKFDITYPDGTTDYVKEEFAIANFVTLSDSEKLSRKSFEPMKSGVQFTSSNSTSHGFEIQKEVNYELSYVHRTKQLVIKAGLVKFFGSVFNILVNGSAVTKNAFSVSKKISIIPPAEVKINLPGYSVVNVSDLSLAAEGMTALSEAEAYQMQEELIRKDPALKNNIQVVSQFELSG